MIKLLQSTNIANILKQQAIKAKGSLRNIRFIEPNNNIYSNLQGSLNKGFASKKDKNNDLVNIDMPKKKRKPSKSTKHEEKSEKKEESTTAGQNIDVKENQQKTQQTTENENQDTPQPRTAPLTSIKFPIPAGVNPKLIKKYVIFTSKDPFLPYYPQQVTVSTGNLEKSQIENNEIAFFLNEDGQNQNVYRIGVVLDKEINKKIYSQLKSQEYKKPQQLLKNSYSGKIEIKKQNYRVQIIEIEHTPNGLFVKCIPYKDEKLTRKEKQVNLIEKLQKIIEYMDKIKQLTNDKLDLFNEVYLESLIMQESGQSLSQEKLYKSKELEETLFKILISVQKLSGYFKKNINTFLQEFLESNILQKVLQLQKKLEECIKSLQMADHSLRESKKQAARSEELISAKYAVEYINNMHFTDEQQRRNAGFNIGNIYGGGQPQGGMTASQTLSTQSKKFFEKLTMIPDITSREKVKKEIERFAQLDRSSSEYHKLYIYLDEIFSIPWNKYTDEVWDTEFSKDVLNKNIYGLEKVKDRIQEMISVNKLKKLKEEGKKKGQIVLLYGPPGTGKTSIAKIIPQAIKREMRFISFAGVTDPHFIKGHRRTYVDSQPGIFVKELVRAKTMNPVFIIDEIDKVSKSNMGADPYTTLLEILNPEENHNFVDHYLDIPLDFSQCLFIITANNVLQMLEPLRNRLEIIEIPPYTIQEKIIIAKQYLLPKVLDENGLQQDSIQLDDATIQMIIKGWCYGESGVRELRRSFEKMSRKHANYILGNYNIKKQEMIVCEQPQGAIISKESSVEAQVGTGNQAANFVLLDESGLPKETSQPQDPTKEYQNNKQQQNLIKEDLNLLQTVRQQSQLRFNINEDLIQYQEKLKNYLGLPDYEHLEQIKKSNFVDKYDSFNQLGQAYVLTVAGFIGRLLKVECVYNNLQSEKKGTFSVSGNIKLVLQESLKIAKIVASSFLPPEKIQELMEKNIHIHFLDGASKKDGPSAGSAITTALLSLMLNQIIPNDVAMTGEITLNGMIMKIGGLQAKITAAQSLDVYQLIIPHSNKGDFWELPEILKEGLTVYFVREYKEIFELLFNNKIYTNDHKIEYYKDKKYYNTEVNSELIPDIKLASKQYLEV